MATVAEVKKSMADWVKWAVVLIYAVLTGIIVHEVNGEHRLTTLETNQSAHEKAAADTKTDVYRRLDRQDENQAQLIKLMGEVKASIATIQGYLEGSKEGQKTAKQQ
jgi:hypothetical protein